MRGAFKSQVKKGPQSIRKLSSTGSQSEVSTRMRESSRTAGAEAKVKQPYKAAAAQRPDAPLNRFPGDAGQGPKLAPGAPPTQADLPAALRPQIPAPKTPQGAGPLVPPEPQMRSQPLKPKEPEPVKVKPLEGLRPLETRPDTRFPGDGRGLSRGLEKPLADKPLADKPL
ncbi:MAG: hypothetical protein KF760_25310, partial [Candidatus Eremiobacteraeota bacterium]|nr:hypothetical protein [Candidatus Eremiobacteraeota bacterium]